MHEDGEKSLGGNRRGADYIEISGRQPVMEALAGNWPVLRIYLRGQTDGPLREIVKKAKAKHVEIVSLSVDSFDRKFSGKRQGIVAVARDVDFYDPDSVLESIPRGESPLFVALDGIEDPHNMGAIIRTSLAMGVSAVIVPRRRTAALGEGTAKASAGAVFRQPICQVPNIHRFIQWSKDRGLWVYGLDMSGQDSIWEAEMSGGITLVVGGEGKGLSHLARQSCDVLVRIPMIGQIGSLNASVACGMALSEIQRQRHAKSPGS